MANGVDSARLLFVVAAALTDREGRVLVQKRPPGRSLADLWEFPGGKVEAGETPEQALLRELNEELGITASAANLGPISFASESLGDRHLVLLLYLLDVWNGEPHAHHAAELRWVRPAKLREMAMPPADLPFIAVLESLLG